MRFRSASSTCSSRFTRTLRCWTLTAFLSAAAPIHASDTFDIITKQSDTPTSTVWRIENPNVKPPRLLRITDAAQYLSCTYTWVETLIRERTIPSVIQGKRRLIDIRDLDAYIDQLKSEAA
jgi:excisionase family DNA binding protein